VFLVPPDRAFGTTLACSLVRHINLGHSFRDAGLAARLQVPSKAEFFIVATDKLYGLNVLFQNSTIWSQSGGNRIEAMKDHIDAAASLGTEVIRFPGDWSALQEKGPGQYARWYIEEVKAVVAYAEQKGIKIVMMMAQSPEWATSSTAAPGSAAANWTPPNASAVDDYARAMVVLHNELKAAGLADNVAAWQVWNEPNVMQFWRGSQLRDNTDVQVDLSETREYVRLLNATYDAMKANDASAVILGGSLAGADIDYLKEMYRLGAKYDHLAMNPYAKANQYNDGIPFAPDQYDARDPLSLVWSFEYGVEKLREFMVSKGDAEKSLWFMEFGYTSEDRWGGVRTEQRQAEYMKKALEIIKTWDFVDAAIAYRLFDAGSEEYGMRNEDGSLKPVGQVFRDFIAQQDGNGSPNIGLPKSITGSRYNDTLIGNKLDNQLNGGAGNDTIKGMAGRDVLIGGQGADRLWGGVGADRFDFNAVSESPWKWGMRDVLEDFQPNVDTIDLRTIDANTLVSGNQAFYWIGSNAFSGAAGELRMKAFSTGTYISADVNGNGSADFGFFVRGTSNIDWADFLM
jgi:hypothetical protein